jgi:hypothetical protein
LLQTEHGADDRPESGQTRGFEKIRFENWFLGSFQSAMKSAQETLRPASFGQLEGTRPSVQENSGGALGT